MKSDARRRRNVVVLNSVHSLAKGLMRARLKGNNFSGLIEDLIIEEHQRSASDKAQADLRPVLVQLQADLTACREQKAKLAEALANWKSKYRYMMAAIKRENAAKP